MKYSQEWQQDFEHELARARRAREEGNEGMARVCSRRAAGIVIQAYYTGKGRTLPGNSVLKHLKTIYESEDEPENVREVCRHFTLQITTDHVLPNDVDLINDVVWLKNTLFPA